jgi:hypothetical protein
MIGGVFGPFDGGAFKGWSLSASSSTLSLVSASLGQTFKIQQLIGGFVVACGAAGFAVHQAVRTNADIEYGLTEAAVLVALALTFGHFALRATGFGLAGSGGHNRQC